MKHYLPFGLLIDVPARAIWGWESSYSVDDAVRYYIKTLRKKLSVGGKNYIETVHGVGYKLNPHGVAIEKQEI